MNTNQLAHAFNRGFVAKYASARTGPTDHGFGYWLHGHLIAERIGQSLNLNWCGWYTGTTARHMKAVADAVGARVRISYAADRDANVTSFGTTF